MSSKIRLLLPLAAVAVTGLAAWWWFLGGGDLPVTEKEARSYLDKMVAAAEKKDFEKLCELNGSVLNCRRQLDIGCDETPGSAPAISCRDTVPSQAPSVVATRYSEKKSSNDTPGRVLVVRGIDGMGEQYETEVFVFRENRHHFKAINAVYWSNARILDDNASHETTPPH
jgi:hypothetical protein